MARIAPKQERSIASMNRMLEAGEQLFYEGGAPALTLEAVIERAETSTGAFYGRFGDMRGFLDAMHERMIDTLANELGALVARVELAENLDSAVRSICLEFFDAAERRHAQIYFFAVGNSQDAKWRAQGSQLMIQFTTTIGHIVAKHLQRPLNAATKRRIDIAVRMIIAAVFQQITFEHQEISRTNVSTTMMANEVATMVVLYLREAPAK